MNCQKQSGFTLIEILFVVTVMALITVITIPQFVNFSEDRSLTDAVELIQTRLNLTRNNAATGVNGSWYGMYFKKDSTIEEFEIRKPQNCSEYQDPIRSSTGCYQDMGIKTVALPSSVKIDTLKLYLYNPETNVRQEILTDDIEIRFGRGQQAYFVAIVSPYQTTSPQNSPEIYRAEIIMKTSSGSLERKIVIEGGNICREPLPFGAINECSTVSGVNGGFTEGRMYIVEPSI